MYPLVTGAYWWYDPDDWTTDPRDGRTRQASRVRASSAHDRAQRRRPPSRLGDRRGRAPRPHSGLPRRVARRRASTTRHPIPGDVSAVSATRRGYRRRTCAASLVLTPGRMRSVRCSTVSIRETFIAAKSLGEDGYYEPPWRELSLSVIGTDAHLSVVELDEQGNRQEASRDIVVPAQSLLLALQSAIQDSETRDNETRDAS